MGGGAAEGAAAGCAVGRVPSAGVRLRLAQAVARIEYGAAAAAAGDAKAAVTVVLASGERLACGACICTLPLGVLKVAGGGGCVGV